MFDPHNAALQHTFDSVLARLTTISQDEGHVVETLKMLELEAVALDTAVAALSDGQKTRLALAGVLLSEPEVLLLDEPTNHLEIALLEWLEN